MRETRSSRLNGLGGNDILLGGGTDTIDGGVGNDSILGGDASDTLKGSQGADIVVGDLGKDTLTGGESNMAAMMDPRVDLR
jgi:Ca2+-binding RTX toxin-like protein